MDRRNFLVGSAAAPIAIPFASWGKEFEFPTIETYDDLQQAIWEATIYLNEKFNGRLSRAGELTHNKRSKFKTFVIGGIKEEGGPLPVYENDPHYAFYMWIDPILNEAKGGGNLVWRILPEMNYVSQYLADMLEYERGDYYNIRTRLVFE